MARVPPLTPLQNLTTLPPAVPQQVFQALLLAKMQMEQQPDQPGVRIDQQLYENVTRCADLCTTVLLILRVNHACTILNRSVPIASQLHACALHILKLTGRSRNAWCSEPMRT